jgi:hypothetical protein
MTMAIYPNYGGAFGGFDADGHLPSPNPAWGMAPAAPPAPGAGPLSGMGDWWQSGIPAALGGALLAAHGNLGNGLAIFGEQAPAVIADGRRRMALNKWLLAKSQGGEIDPQTAAVLQTDPDLAAKYMTAMTSPERQFGRVGTDIFGQPAYGWIQPGPMKVAPVAQQGAGAHAKATGSDGSQAASNENMPRVTNAAEYALVPKGKSYIDPHGNVRLK